MPITDAMKAHVAGLIIGEVLTPFNAQNAHIGVGDSLIAFDVSQTDLQAATNKLRKPVDSGYPIRTGKEIEWRNTYMMDEANFNWNERGVFNALSGGLMALRHVGADATYPTKLQGEIWICRVIATT